MTAIHSLFSTTTGRLRLALAVLSAVTLSLVVHAQAFAAADSLTGVDPLADVATPALASAKPWILAGIGIALVGMAIGLGVKWLSKVGGAKK